MGTTQTRCSTTTTTTRARAVLAVRVAATAVTSIHQHELPPSVMTCSSWLCHGSQLLALLQLTALGSVAACSPWLYRGSQLTACLWLCRGSWLLALSLLAARSLSWLTALGSDAARGLQFLARRSYWHVAAICCHVSLSLLHSIFVTCCRVRNSLLSLLFTVAVASIHFVTSFCCGSLQLFCCHCSSSINNMALGTTTRHFT
jgi:hypothetical protein